MQYALNESTMATDEFTAIGFITSIEALKGAITLPTSWDVFSICTSEQIHSTICLYNVI